MRAVVVAAALTGALSSPTAFADVSAADPQVPVLRASDGIVLDAKSANECGGPPGERHFTPSVAEVKRLEASLVAAIAAVAAGGKSSFRVQMAARLLTHVGTDRRFYIGVVGPEGRYLRVEGYCKRIMEHASDSCPPTVNDGGHCVWVIRFDVKSGTFNYFATAGG